MSLIRFRDVDKQFDSSVVLRGACLRLESGDRVALLGNNGSGKTTLLKLILGQEQPTAGTVEIARGLRLGYFSQFSELEGSRSIDEILDDLFVEVRQHEARLLALEREISDASDPQVLDARVQEQTKILEEMDRLDGWNVGNQIDTALTRLGFAAHHRSCPVDALSGGWRNRAALAQILLESPDLLLLDEPTNFLDVQGLSWLEGWIQKFPGALLLVSHDRHFIERTAKRIVEIENHHLQDYDGPFSEYLLIKKLRFKKLQRQFEHEEELLALESEAVVRRREALKNPSKTLKRKLANVGKAKSRRPVDRIVTSIYGNLEAPQRLCEVEGIAKSYEGRPIFADVSFELRRRDRVCVLGPNGCGKSTLLRVVAQQEAPDAGTVTWRGPAPPFVFFNQVLDELDPHDTVSHATNVVGLASDAPRKVVHRFLGLLRFSDLDQRQKIGTLSGGQKARVALAQSLLSGAPTVILDEPTNHLDLASTQVMELALAHFPGAVVVVSHDRFFIDKVANRLLVFDREGGVRSLVGNWSTLRAAQAGPS